MYLLGVSVIVTANKSQRERYKIAAVFGVLIVGLTGMLLLPRIPQDPSYHNFADQRQIFGIPNFWNIITNVPFIAVGLVGLRSCMAEVPRGGLQALAPIYRIFFLGVLLVGFGSAYYHLSPSTQTLIWDRLPMSITFMAFFSLVWGEHISVDGAKRVLGMALILGMGSVTYWYVTEAQGDGDLRPYGLIQFLPILLIPMIVVLFPSRLSNTVYIWLALAVYVVAKLAEHWDSAIYELSGFISGHALKHLLAALGTFFILIALIRRRPATTRTSSRLGI